MLIPLGLFAVLAKLMKDTEILNFSDNLFSYTITEMGLLEILPLETNHAQIIFERNTRGDPNNNIANDRNLVKSFGANN